MEPLLHFAIPFALATLLRLRLKWALMMGLVGVLPDFDVLFFMHRSVSHTMLPALLLFLASLLVWRSSRVRVKAPLLIVGLGWGSHVFLDFIQWYTPILWPLSSKSYMLVFESTLFMESPPYISWSLRVLEKTFDYGPFTSFDAPLFTASGAAIGLLLITLALSIHYGGLRSVVEKLFLRKGSSRKRATYEKVHILQAGA